MDALWLGLRLLVLLAVANGAPVLLKRVLGRVGYMGWAALQYARFEPFTLIVDDGGGEKRLRALEVRISNGSYQGGTEVVEAARVDSGEIVVQAVTGHFKRRLLRHWAASVLRLPQRHDDTVEFTGTSLRVATEPPLPISIDGTTMDLDFGDVREDRVVLYTTAEKDVKEFVYVLKATNVGTYRVAPVLANSMYDRSVLGRDVGGHITVFRK